MAEWMAKCAAESAGIDTDKGARAQKLFFIVDSKFSWCTASVATFGEVEVVQYSERSLACIGQTFELRNVIKDNGGKFNKVGWKNANCALKKKTCSVSESARPPSARVDCCNQESRESVGRASAGSRRRRRRWRRQTRARAGHRCSQRARRQAGTRQRSNARRCTGTGNRKQTINKS